MKNRSLVFTLPVLLILGLSVISCVKTEDTSSDADLKSLADKSIEVINTGNMELASEVYSPDIKRHLVDRVRPLVEGLDAFNQYCKFLRTAYPDMKFVATDTTVSGDKIILVYNFTGTNSGPRGNMQPTGKKVDFSGVVINQVVDGKITEQWVYANMASLYRQLGFTIKPPSAEK